MLLLRPAASLDPVDLELKPRPGQGLILVANHRSVVDILVGLALFWHWGVAPRMLVQARYFATPVAGPLLRLLRAIPASRDTARATMEAASATLQAGGIVALAPEGRVARAADRRGAVSDLRTGTGRLAAELGTPIVAIGLVNTDAVWPHGTRLPRIRARKSARPVVGVAINHVSVARGEPVALIMARLQDALSDAVRTADRPLP
ncbi:lysophospholipid acyltransferase family protein [Micromonospora sp. NPDC047187]|uniref:lysophospholipid acyltransferase family protein n=1 Tax=Micromonospora sp. NPDC047187 TaxID=3155262 RepID=UPI0033D31955